MKIYSRTNDPFHRGRRTVDSVIGKDIWFKCFYKNDMYWYHIIGTTDIDYIGQKISDTRIWRLTHKSTAEVRNDTYVKIQRGDYMEQFPIRNYKKRFNEALQSTYSEMLTTQELLGLSENDLEDID